MPKKNVIKKNALAPTVLIAGGAGFIGSHICETLLQKDARVVVLDNFKTGKENYIGHLVQNPKFAVYNADISKGIPEEIESVDYILHLAGLEEYLYSKTDINLDSLLTNALGTKNLLDLANRSLAKFLLVSTTDVYQGMISQIDLKKYFGDTAIEEKQYSQTEAKRFAEALVWEYFKKSNTNVRIVRVPEVYGPRMDYESTGELGRILKDVSDNKDLTLYGEGTDKQYYLYITDAVSGILKALFNQNTEGKIFPLVDLEAYSPLEIVFLIKSLANRELKIDFKPAYREIQTAPYVPDVSSLSELGWDIKTSFKEGVIKTLKWSGYDVNENTFKPAKFIEDLKKQKQISFADKTVPFGAVSSLTDDFTEPPKPKPAIPQSYSNAKPKPLLNINPFSHFSSHEVQAPKDPVLAAVVPAPPQEQVTKAAPLRVTAATAQKIQRKPLFNVPKLKLGGPIYLTLLTLFFVFVVFVGIPAVQTFINAGRAVNEVTKVKDALTQLDSEASQQSAKDAYVYFSKAQKSLSKIDWVFSLAGKHDTFTSLNDLFGSLTYFSKFSYNFSKAAYPFTQVWDSVQPNNSSYLSEESFQDSEASFMSAKENLQFAISKTANLDVSALPETLRDNADVYKKALTDLSLYLSDFFEVSPEIPTLLGVQGEKRYLVLFQNSNEMRPTGGFIGSYATITLDRGKIKDLTIDDIYNPDGQLYVRDIKFPLPTELGGLLKEDRSTIHNANWNPDFRESSEDIMQLFKALGYQKYDGVIAVDLKFAESLLKVTGPVFLTAYNEEISAANMYERAQFHSEFNYKDGSDQKKSFLTVLGSKLLERVFSLEQKDMPMLFDELNSLIVSKDILVYLPNTRMGAVLNKYGWDGSLRSFDKDFLYVVNANVGGTKANYFVKNNMEYNITSKTRDGVLRGELVLTYEHTGKDNSWPSGPYTNFVRVYVPNGSKLTAARVNTNNVFDEDVFKKVTEVFDGNYKYFAYELKVEPTETVKLSLSYDLPESLNIAKSGSSYSLVWQKQPGTNEDAFTFSFAPPFGINVDHTSDNLSKESESYVRRGSMNSDNFYSIDFK